MVAPNSLPKFEYKAKLVRKLYEKKTDTAEPFGIKNDDWVWIENPRGKVLHKARITRDIDKRVVSCEPGWWYPEKGGPFYGVWESNISLLTSLDGPYDPVQGTPTLRTMLCKVSKVAKKDLPHEHQFWLSAKQKLPARPLAFTQEEN